MGETLNLIWLVNPSAVSYQCVQCTYVFQSPARSSTAQTIKQFNNLMENFSKHKL